MRICIVNQSAATADRDVQHAIRAVNAQLVDVAYHWSVVVQCRLEGTRSMTKRSLSELRGDALIYITSETDPDALGWHEADKFGLPWGVVTIAGDEPWTVTLSHEVLELALDPHCNRLARGPHPTEKREVFHWYELCDAVQADTYAIAGVKVSDWLLPAWFTPHEERGMRLSYLGAPIRSFGVATGGYLGFYDPQIGGHATFAPDELGRAAVTAKAKGRAAKYRRCST